MKSVRSTARAGNVPIQMQMVAVPLEIVISKHKLQGTAKAAFSQIKDRDCCLPSLQKGKPVIGTGYVFRRQDQTGHGFRISEADRLGNRTLRHRTSGRNCSVSAMPPA